jgi:hypothetical protein
VPRLCEFYPGICLTTEEKARKNLSQGKKNLSHSTVYILPKTPTHYKALTNTHIKKPTHTHTTKQYLMFRETSQTWQLGVETWNESIEFQLKMEAPSFSETLALN